MTKKLKYYFFTSLIILASVIVYLSIRVPRIEYTSESFHVWDMHYVSAGNFKSGEELYIYSNVTEIDHVSFELNELLGFYDENNNLIFQLQILNLENSDEPAFYYDLSSGDEDHFQDYNLLGKLQFQDGYYNMQIINGDYSIRDPFITTAGEIEKIITDYTDYAIIPVITGFMGILFFIIIVFSHKRPSGDSRYSQGKHSSKSNKREKY